jgi:hypothetical protein
MTQHASCCNQLCLANHKTMSTSHKRTERPLTGGTEAQTAALKGTQFVQRSPALPVGFHSPQGDGADKRHKSADSHGRHTILSSEAPRFQFASARLRVMLRGVGPSGTTKNFGLRLNQKGFRSQPPAFSVHSPSSVTVLFSGRGTNSTTTELSILQGKYKIFTVDRASCNLGPHMVSRLLCMETEEE